MKFNMNLKFKEFKDNFFIKENWAQSNSYPNCGFYANTSQKIIWNLEEALLYNQEKFFILRRNKWNPHPADCKIKSYGVKEFIFSFKNFPGPKSLFEKTMWEIYKNSKGCSYVISFNDFKDQL